MKHKTLTITYYHSNLIEEMLFGSEEDAEYFDNTLEEYINTPEAIEEFKSVKFASIEAVNFNIKHDMFVDYLEGDYSEKLIEAAERMVDGYNGTTADDCYKLPLLYIFDKVYGKYYK